MTVDTIFAQALAKSTPAERTAYLDEACAHDLMMRQRVETLLQSHEAAGDFLGKPAIQCAAEALAGPARAEDTQCEAPAAAGDQEPLDFLAASDKPDSLGRLGHYEVLEIVGRGGMGIVLRALDDQLHRVVAIKVMAAQLATNATARRRFAREAQAAAAVSHDHIVTIHAVEEAAPLPYLVMQFVAGLSLQQRLDRDGSFDLQEILRIGMQTASGLAAAHAQGLVHRDIKPANILLENGVERVKITDFGLARAIADANLTQSGVVAGTPQFMSPEQARGDPVDQRTDLFSLGSVLYAMCTGRAPFRGSNSMSVLKRVCEEVPTPIRETNPEIPDWLVAIIDKLHAKDPAERYQSAIEVAALLGRHLAHVQHPSVALLPVGVAGTESAKPRDIPLAGTQPRPYRRRLAVAAAVLMLVLAGLSLTEVLGVTNLRTAVIRIFTPEGTLVVEVDDPGVKVTIEGDDGLVITGAGAQEVRLRPGSYRVQADKDGKPILLERELVNIAKGGREVVRVKLEAPPAQATAKAATGAFVLLAAGKERKFDTLADAVQGASDGDTIEVRGNGPFVSEPISIRKCALTIRAAPGFRPVIRLIAERETGPFFLESDAALVLEGLELQRETQDSHSPKGESWRAIIYTNAPLYAANCRFLMKGLHACILAHSPIVELRNCEFLCPDVGALSGDCSAGQRWGVENCVHTGGACVHVTTDLNKVSIRVVRNTVVGSGSLSPILYREASALATDRPEPPVRVEASGNVFDTWVSHMNFEQSQPKPLPAAEAEAVLRRTLAWHGHGNLYAVDQAFLSLTVQWKVLEPATPVKNLADWKQFWGGAEVDSLEGRVRYQGGNILTKLRATPEKLTPDDFRLRTDSAGYKAGKDGKDLGADVDLVGPGPAYERWKKTPDYQQWLKDTKQVKKAETPTGEPKAFVLLGGKGIAERKFDTLAEAVLSASAGDTIEIRGNGPFISDPVSLGDAALVIRAADGFRPVLKLTAEAFEKGLPLLETSAPLVLEGLELQQVRQTIRAGGIHSMLISHEAPLWLANCRLFMKDPHQMWLRAHYCPTVELHNCEFFTNGEGFFLVVDKSSKCLVSNCVQAGGNTFGVTSFRPGAREALVRLERNTLATSTWLVHLSVGGSSSPKLWGLAPEHKLVRIKAADNILDAKSALTFTQWPETPPQELWSGIKGQEAETAFRKMIQWDDGRNVFAPGASSIDWLISGASEPPHGPKSLPSWKKFWGNPNADALEGQVRYQGGNLSGLLASGPDKLTAEHFRLRPDSAGYRAGKDGKDLGADVDLVGPGPAYERWKKTPAYQQWLKDSGQVKK